MFQWFLNLAADICSCWLPWLAVANCQRLKSISRLLSRFLHLQLRNTLMAIFASDDSLNTQRPLLQLKISVHFKDFTVGIEGEFVVQLIVLILVQTLNQLFHQIGDRETTNLWRPVVHHQSGQLVQEA